MRKWYHEDWFSRQTRDVPLDFMGFKQLPPELRDKFIPKAIWESRAGQTDYYSYGIELVCKDCFLYYEYCQCHCKICFESYSIEDTHSCNCGKQNNEYSLI